MLNSPRTEQHHLRFSRAHRGRSALLLLVLTLALVPFSWTSQPTQKLRVGMAAVALGDTSTRPARSNASTATLAIVDAVWDASDWRGWEGQVREIQAPPDIDAGEPLRVEVHALDASGGPLANARVEVTWILPDRQYRDTGTTSAFGQLSSTRTLGATCCDKRCVVAVTVEGDRGVAYAYSAFQPK